MTNFNFNELTGSSADPCTLSVGNNYLGPFDLTYHKQPYYHCGYSLDIYPGAGTVTVTALGNYENDRGKAEDISSDFFGFANITVTSSGIETIADGNEIQKNFNYIWFNANSTDATAHIKIREVRSSIGVNPKKDRYRVIT